MERVGVPPQRSSTVKDPENRPKPGPKRRRTKPSSFPIIFQGRTVKLLGSRFSGRDVLEPVFTGGQSSHDWSAYAYPPSETRVQ